MKLLSIISILLTFTSLAWASLNETREFTGTSKLNLDQIHDRVAPWIQQFEEDLSPLVLNHGGELHLVLDWDSDRVNAEAKRNGREFMIIIYSGLITKVPVKRTTLELILCHELGHHLGGTPLASRQGWSSSEGQADYYSTLECAKELKNISYDEMKKELEILAKFYAQIDRSPLQPSLNHVDSNIVNRTFFGYPNAQCRLDTLIAGWENKPRPLCWYRPESH